MFPFSEHSRTNTHGIHALPMQTLLKGRYQALNIYLLDRLKQIETRKIANYFCECDRTSIGGVSMFIFKEIYYKNLVLP